MINQLIDKQLLKDLTGMSMHREFKEFHVVLSNLELEGYDFKYIREFVEQWVEDSAYIEFENNEETRIIYTLTQWYTFEMKRKQFVLYRGIHAHSSIINKIKESKRITTNRITSFTTEMEIAEVFARMCDKRQEQNGLVIESLVNTENILMTYWDWMENVEVKGETEREFVVLNLTRKAYPIKILGEY